MAISNVTKIKCDVCGHAQEFLKLDEARKDFCFVNVTDTDGECGHICESCANQAVVWLEER